MKIQMLADIAGDDAAHVLNPSPVRWLQVIVAGAGTVRIGDATVSSSVGIPVVAEAGLMIPPSDHTQLYDAGSIYAFIPTGATLSILVGR